MKSEPKDKAYKLSIDIYSNILELRKLVHKGIDVKVNKQTYIDLSESLKRLANEVEKKKI